ncbi:MAG: hypothetical protein BGP12_03435 [Rhodospirillales bacterium 70-18]|nr:MAG: hypothetical protein BGP12_03435 [Rhodospirillales bacterium 70-18]
MLSAVALPTGASAQAPATPPPAAAPIKPHRDRMLTPEQRAQRVEQHIARLHTQLGITAAQQPQWDAFATVMRDNAANMTKTFDKRGASLATMNAAANMQSYADIAVAHAQDIQRLATSFQSLYDTMSDSQKHTADLLFRRQPGARGKS